MWWETVLRCPVCGASVEKVGGSLLCGAPRRHCVDFAKEGYLNLSPPVASGGGDDAVLIGARTAFLEAGHYSPFADKIKELLTTFSLGGVVLDAGCGEGYYTNRLSKAGFSVIGLDLSKQGIRHAAKAAKQQGSNALFVVSGLYTLPVADASLDAIVSIFAPIAEEEFLRALRPGGVLITAAAGEEHLKELKEALYDTPRKNAPRADLPQSMALLHREVLDFQMELAPADIQNLFTMTPYYYRTSREGRERLEALPHLSCIAQMDISVYQKP